MEKDIVNRVANSKLQTIDLEDFYPSGKRTALDIKQWLFQGIILKENEFRAFLKGHDWSQYKDQYVALNCSTDAIIPSWAFMLVSTYLNPYSKLVIVGDIPMLETAIFLKIISDFDVSPFKDKPVIIKGCSNKPIPETAYLDLISKLQPVVSSLMFGEACSTVPLLKKSRL